VRVPLSTAYNQWTQFEEFPRLMEGIEEVRQLDETHLHWDAGFGGRRHELEKVGDAIGAPDRRVKGDLQGFNEMIESRGRESGAWRGQVDRPDEP
jgi:Polyketide cyclase / dehydrase and lipid transport